MRALGITLISGLLAIVCQASIITTDPGTGTTTVFTSTGLTQAPGPFTINGFSVNGSTDVAFGNVPYGLGTNGAWTEFSFVAANSSTDSITFDLGASYSLAGGNINYSTPHDPEGVNPTIDALAANGTTVLESYLLSDVAPISTPGGSNQTAFRGIARSQADIRFLRLSGDFITTHSLEVGQVPEPGTFALILGGLGLVFLGRRRPLTGNSRP